MNQTNVDQVSGTGKLYMSTTCRRQWKFFPTCLPIKPCVDKSTKYKLKQCCWVIFKRGYHKTSNIRCILIGPWNCWSLRCSWSIAWRRCSNYIFILNLTPGINGWSEDNCKRIQETFKFWDLVRLNMSYTSVPNYCQSVSPKQTTLEEDWELFLNFSSILCLWFKIQGSRTDNFFDWVLNTAYTRGFTV